MAKGSFVDLSSGPRRASSSQSSFNTPSSRTSVLAAVVPYFRRRETEDLPSPKQPLLSLKFTSFSFLLTQILDDVTEQPLYTIKTRGSTTIIKRADAWDGEIKIAEIRWASTPSLKGKNVSDGVLINMKGNKYKGSETLLRRGSVYGGPRKFNIPNYAHSLKWKIVGSSYWCTTSCVKGPIASFKPATNTLPSKFEIYETFHDKKDVRPMLVHHGVSVLLLDYLLVTALFLVTDSQEWAHFDKSESQEVTVPVSSSDLTGYPTPKSAAGSISTAELKWRKIMYGQPLFPQRSSRSSLDSGSTTLDAFTSASSEHLASGAYGRSLYPTIRSNSPEQSISNSEDADEDIFFTPALTGSASRPPSPSSESIFYPLTRGGAPSHTYIDPSFYNEDEEIPVPPIPARFSISPTNSSSNYTSRSRPSSSHSGSSSGRRLPETPLPPMPLNVFPPIVRPRSTPPRTMSSPATTQHTGVSESSFASGSAQMPSANPPAPPRRPTRQLPQLPTSTSTAPPPPRADTRVGIGRSRSHSQSHSTHESIEKWRSRGTYAHRILPSPPTSSSHPLETRTISDRGPYPYPKEAEDDITLSRWVGAPVPLTGPAFDMPPPAYNSINFSSSVVEDPSESTTG